MKKKAIRKLEVLLHAVTAAILLIKGIDEIKRQVYYPGVLLIVISFIILLVLFFWRPLKIKPKKARLICYFIEMPGLFISSYLFYLEGKEYLSDVFLLAGILYPAVGLISSKTFKKISKHAS